MPLERISGRTTFWESATRDGGYFLVACDYSAKRNWRGLLQVAGEWIRQEPYSPEACMARGRARLNLGDTDDAIGAFRKALQLDSTHAEAWWELQKLESIWAARSLAWRIERLRFHGCPPADGVLHERWCRHVHLSSSAGWLRCLLARRLTHLRAPLHGAGADS